MKDWTTVASTPLTVSGLTLTDRTRYYVNMRAADNVGLKSAIVSDFWVVDTNGAVSITLAASYPTNGAKWNDYVKNDGVDTVSGTDTACVGTETNRTDCMHGGEIRKATIAAESSCTGLIARDNLGAFNWSCKVVSGQAVVYSTGLKSTKNLRDLIDFTTPDWRTNYLIVTGGVANTTYQSSSAKWWTNSFAALPDNSANAGTSQSLSVASTIYVLSASRVTSGGYSVTADKVGVVGSTGVALSWNGSSVATTTTCGSRTIMCVSGRKYAWVDINVSGGTGTNKAQYGYFISASTSFSRFGNISATGIAGHGIYITASTKSLFGDLTLTSNTGTGLYMYAGASSNTFGNVVANSNTGTGAANHYGVALELSCSSNTFTSISASSNTRGGVSFSSTANNSITVTNGITASNNLGPGVNGSSATGYTVGGITANSNAGHGVYLLGVSSSSFGNITASNNTGAGLLLYNNSSSNTFGNVVANSNTGPGAANHYGVALELSCSSNTFASISASSNTRGGVSFTSTANNSITVTNGITASSNLGPGVNFSGSSATGFTIGGITANSNAGHGVYLQGVSSSSFSNITASNNTGSGLYLYNNSSSNTFGTVVTNSNTGISAANHYGVALELTCISNTFSSITANLNTRGGVSLTSTVNNSLTVSGYINASYNSGIGVYITGGSGHRIGNVYVNNNDTTGLFLSATGNSRFGNVVANGNKSTTDAGVHLDGAIADIRFNSISANNNLFVGFYVTSGTISGLIIRDFLLTTNNAYGFANNGTLNYSIINNATVASNTNYGFNLGIGSYNILKNFSTANNGTYGFGMAGAGTNNSIINLISTNNGTFGISHLTQTTAAYLGTLMVGNNTSGNCTVSGTTPGLVTTTCSTAGTDGSIAYGAGAFSSAVLRISKTQALSFTGFINATGDNTNSSDGASGIGSGQALWDSSIDMLNFDNIFRAYINPGSAITGLSSSQWGPGLFGSPLKIWDWSLATSDSTLLNKSGNGSNINNGVTLSSNGTVTSGANSYAEGSSCPLQVLGDRFIESRPYTFDATNNPLSTSGFQSAGSGTACASGNTTCVRRFLMNATELTGDGIGNDDGLCESNESCVYNPNFGAYQGHFDANEAIPTINDSSHECTWTSNSGSITNVRMYGYKKNGR